MEAYNNIIPQKQNLLHRIVEALYYIVVVLYCIGCFMMFLNWSLVYPGMAALGKKISDVARVIMMILLLEQFNHSIKRGLISLAIIVLNTGYYLYCGAWGPADLLLVYALSDHTDEEGMKKVLLLLYTGLIAALTVLGMSGAIKNVGIPFSYRKGLSLGFGHPNTVGVFVFSLIVMLRITLLKRQNTLFFVVCLGAAAFSWFYPASRTAVVLLILYPVLSLILGFLQKKNLHSIVKLFILLPIVMAVFSISLTLYITYANPTWAHGMDDNAMARFSCPAVFLRESGLTLGGVDIDGRLPLDNGYNFVLVCRGILWEIVIVSLLTMIMHHLIKMDKMEYIAAFSLFMVQGVMESTFLNPFYNVIPIFALSIRHVTDEKKVEVIKLENKGKVALSVITAAICLISIILIHNPKVSDMTYVGEGYPNTSVTRIINKETVLSQSITTTTPMKTVRVLMATYGTQPVGEYRFEVLNENGNILESKDIMGNDIHDCELLEIVFDRNIPEGKYILRFSGIKTEGDSVVIWQNESDPYVGGKAYVNNEPTDADWSFDYGYMAEDHTWIYRGIIAMIWLILTGFLWLA